MGRKKKPGGKEKDPFWLVDPYDYSAPWGAPIIRESDIVEEIDKAPPLSYFKEHAEEVIKKPQRVRRKKTIFDDLLKDPLTQLREGLELIKRKHQKQEEGSTNAQVDSTKTQVRDSGRDVQESSGLATTPTDNNVPLPTSVKGEIEKKSKGIEISNPKMDQKDISVTNKKEQEEILSTSRSSPSSTSSSSESEVEKKNKLKKRKKIKTISELNREIQKLRNELESLRQKTEDQRVNEPLENNRDGEKLSDSTRKESDEGQVAGKAKLSEEKSVDKEGTKPGNKQGNKQDGLSEHLHETFEEFVKRMEEGDDSDGDTEPNDLADVTPTDKTTDHEPSKKVFTTGSKEKESTKMDAKGSASKEKSKSKKRTKSKREKRKEKEKKMMKEFFKEFDEGGDENENLSALMNEGKEHFFEEKGGEQVFPSRTAVETFSESNSMYGTTPIPLDSEFIQDNETSRKRELQRFLDSTLQPGDGYVLTDKTK